MITSPDYESTACLPALSTLRRIYVEKQSGLHHNVKEKQDCSKSRKGKSKPRVGKRSEDTQNTPPRRTGSTSATMLASTKEVLPRTIHQVSHQSKKKGHRFHHDQVHHKASEPRNHRVSFAEPLFETAVTIHPSKEQHQKREHQVKEVAHKCRASTTRETSCSLREFEREIAQIQSSMFLEQFQKKISPNENYFVDSSAPELRDAVRAMRLRLRKREDQKLSHLLSKHNSERTGRN